MIILGLIVTFVLLVGIARQQYIYLILLPILIATALSIFSDKFQMRVSNIITRISLKVAIAIGLVMPLLYLEKNKESYYEINFSNRSYVVREDFGVKNEILDSNKEKTNIFFNLPFLDKFKTLIEIRNTYADRYAENFTYIDPIKFDSVAAGIAYLPKSLIIGLTTPLNILSLKNADVHSSTPALQIIAQIEILIFITLICFTIFMVCRYRRELWANIFMGIMYFLPPATIIAFAMPNAGVIVRQRFPFLYISVVLLLVTCFKIFESIEGGKQKK